MKKHLIQENQLSLARLIPQSGRNAVMGQEANALIVSVCQLARTRSNRNVIMGLELNVCIVMINSL